MLARSCLVRFTSLLAAAQSHPNLKRLVDEWHPTRNSGTQLGPGNVSTESRLEAWWRCAGCSAEFKERVHIRASDPNRGCAVCAQEHLLVTGVPEVAAEWDIDRNLRDSGIDIDTVRRDDVRTAWWRCHTCGGAWQEGVADRVTSPNGCPTCNIMKSKTASRVGQQPLQKPPCHTHTSELVSTLCKQCGKHWKHSAHETARLGALCPRCHGTTRSSENLLFARYPSLVDELDPHYTEMHTSRMMKITVNSRDALKWKCRKCTRHYTASPFDRVYGVGCPKCAWARDYYAKEFPQWKDVRRSDVPSRRLARGGNPGTFAKQYPVWRDTMWN
eukprot:PhM_4_TR10263/c0_g2_i1/m.44816